MGMDSEVPTSAVLVCDTLNTHPIVNYTQDNCQLGNIRITAQKRTISVRCVS